MSVGKKGPYHLYLRDVPTSPATEVGLILDLDEEGKPRVSESRVEPLPPRQSQGPIAWTSNDPMVDMVWAMDDWSDGGLRPYYRDGDARYAISDGVDGRWPGVLALNMKQDPVVSFVVPNGGFEFGALGTWSDQSGANTDPTVVVSGSSNAVRTGTYALRLVKSTGAGGAATAVRYTISSTTNLQGRSITFGVWARQAPTDSGTGAMTVGIDDGVAAESTTSQAVTSTYTFVSVTHTVDAASTSLNLNIAIPSAGDPTVWNIDDTVFRVNGTDTCVGVVEAAGTSYAAVGPLILRLNTATAGQHFWEYSSAEPSGAAATSIVSFRDKVYVGYGTSARYMYGVHGSWTQVSAGNNDKAFFFVALADILWKSNSTIQLQHLASTADPALPTSTWISENATDESSPITGLYVLDGGVVVGTERGLVVKPRFGEEFLPVYTPFRTDPDPENFQRGVEKDGWLYLTTAKQGLVRYNGSRVEDLSRLFVSPRHTQFGGRVRAVTADTEQVWCLVDSPTLDNSLTKTVRLVSLMEVGGELAVHPTYDIELGDINALAVAGTHLYYFGRLSVSSAGSYYMSVGRWWLPLKSVAPYQDEIGGRWLESSGYVELPVWHGGLPDTPKALYKATAWVADTSATNYITVSFGVDGAAATTTNLGGTSGDGRLDAGTSIDTLEASTQTAPATDNIGRSFAVRLTFTRASTQTDPNSSRASGTHNSPKLYAIAFHYRLAPDRIRQWELFVRVGGRLRNEQADPQGNSVILSRLNTLETQVYPIEMEEDFDQDDSSSTAVVVIRQLERVFEAPEQKRPGVVGALYRLVLQEVT